MKKQSLSLFLFAAAFLSGLIRYYLGYIFPSKWTLVVINYLGVFLLVFLVKGYFSRKGYGKKAVKVMSLGFLGALTTLASPLLDMTLALQKGQWQDFILSLGVHLLGGLVLAYLSWCLLEKTVGK